MARDKFEMIDEQAPHSNGCVQQEETDHTNSGMLTMPGEHEMQPLSPNGSAGGQEEEPDHTDPGMLNMDEEKKLQSCLINGYAGGQEEQAGCIKRKLLPVWNKHKKAIIIIITIGVVIFIVIVAVVFFFLGRHKPLNRQHDDIKCLPDWIGHQKYCYNFSKEEKTWNESRDFCALHNAFLANIIKEEMDFVKKFTSGGIFWIGLKRELGQPWKSLDGNNATLEVLGHGGGGDCVYLDNSDEASPGTCTIEHHFICKKKRY